jgi:hypothetical protein
MKKNYFITLLLTLCFSVVSFGQGAEPFTNSNATTSYADNSFVGAGGITWTYVASRDDAGTAGVTAPALMLRRVSDDSKITSSTITGGIGDFSVKLYKGFTGGGDRQVELFINGVSKGTSTAFDDFDEHVFTVSGINITGDVIIEIKNTTAKQVIIDDITWTAPSADPSLAITSPTESTVYTTTTVDATISISNFTVSGDNGSGASDNSGDGYIKASLETTGSTTEISNFFTTTLPAITVVPGSAYTLTLELVDNSGAVLSPAVSQSVSFSAEYGCDIALGTITTICDATTSGTDTFSGSIDFTGGDTGATYTITAPVGVTVGGDNPDTVAAGTITFSGITEGADADVMIVGATNSTCNLTRTLRTPNCVPFPVTDSFGYGVGTNLTDASMWSSVNSGDEILVAAGNLDYTGLPTATGNSITFDENGIEAYTTFANVVSGKVYASFRLKVTAFQTSASPDVADGGYIAALAGSTSGYDARLWVRPNPDTAGTTFDIGFGHETSNPNFTGSTYNLNDVVYIVMSYDLDTKATSVWVNPAASSFATTEPAATLTTTDDFPTAVINTFILRQDSDKETPFIQIDELTIDTTWASATASLKENSIEGFVAYPNPISDKRFTVSTANSDNKLVNIYNVLGKQVFTQSFTGTSKTLDVSAISTGIYILKVTEGNKISTKKLVIR